MSFLMPKIPSPPPLPAIPPPPPAPPIKPVDVKTSEVNREEERQRRKKGISSTILTGPRGLTTEEAVSPTTPNLLAGN